jgi:hypothetical protein
VVAIAHPTSARFDRPCAKARNRSVEIVASNSTSEYCLASCACRIRSGERATIAVATSAPRGVTIRRASAQVAGIDKVAKTAESERSAASDSPKARTHPQRSM